jgi:hypothetical protein
MRRAAWLAAQLGLTATNAALGQSPRTTFIAVERGVRLEVLDWGGAGRPLIDTLPR